MRIALPLCTLLLAALSSGCPATSDSGTTPSGGGTPPPSTPSPTPSPSPSPEPAPAPAPTPSPGDGARTAAVPSSHPQYARVEGTSFQNGCSKDDQCLVGGCSSEVCSAEQGVSSTCEAPVAGWPNQGATCGCVQGQCIWYKSGASGGGASGGGTSGGGTSGGGGSEPPAGEPSAGGPAQGQPCSDGGQCAKGLTCVKYYGIAGTRGPEFSSCEIRCKGRGTCPKGQTCTTISDGPGQVCRPAQ